MLRTGEIRESVYKRSVGRQLYSGKKPPLACSLETVLVEGRTLAADRLARNMVNLFAAKGSKVRQMTVSLALPQGTEEPDLRSFMKRLGDLCGEYGIPVETGEIKVLPGVGIPLISAVGLGEDYETKAFPEIRPGLEIVAAGTIACEGAAVLAMEHEEELKERFAGFYVEEAKRLFDHAAMPVVRDILLKEKAAGEAVREAGIFGGLWKLAAAGRVGLDIDLARIPIRQHTVEVCEFFNLNPYMLLSGGCILLAAEKGEEIVSALAEEDIEAAVIGRTTSGNDRIIRYDEEIRYLEPPGTDEIYKMIKNS